MHTINTLPGCELTEFERAQLTALCDRAALPTGDKLRFYAVSGDDVYAVIQRSETEYLYVKLLFGSWSDGGKSSSHDVHDFAIFDDQFKASVHLCEKAREEEEGYGQD